jgi:hypothetical protein
MSETDRRRTSAGRFVADMALRKTGSFARKKMDKRLAAHGFTTKDVVKAAKGQEGFGTRFAAAALVRLATRSVPNALVVGGGLVAMALFNRNRQRGEDDAPAVEEAAE